MPGIFFRENLKFLRQQKGESQASIASLVNKRNTVISSWELGASEPSLTDIGILSDYFGVSVAEMVGLELYQGKDAIKTESPKLVGKGKDSGKDLGKDNAVLSSNPAPTRYDSHLGMPKVITLDSGARENIVHVPIKARAGYLLGYGDPDYIKSLNTYSLPGFREGTFRSFEAEGNSMNPTIKNKDIVIGRWVESLEDIRENRVYIIVTKNDGILIKRVVSRVKEREKLYLRSDNITNRQEYPTIELDAREVQELWYATIKFGTDFSEPGEYFTRLNDVEIKLMEVMKHLQLQ